MLLHCLNTSMLSHCTCSSTKQAPLTEPLHTDHTSFSLAYCSTITLNFFSQMHEAFSCNTILTQPVLSLT